MRDVLEFAMRKTAEGVKVALVTVTETRGSSPATPGQMMAVSADGSTAGTVGGGAAEHRVTEQSAQAIRNGEVIFSFSFDHAEEGMSCGGGMAGYGNVLGGRPELCVFGGGHIAQSLARLASAAGFSAKVVEDRGEFASFFEQANYIICPPDKYEQVNPVSASDYVVICTRGHEEDGAALRYCLSKSPAYIGMIGSKRKVLSLFETLRAQGIKQTELDRVYAPVGLDIADSAPAEIAVAILAEILLVKNGGSLRHKSGDRSHYRR